MRLRARVCSLLCMCLAASLAAVLASAACSPKAASVPERRRADTAALWALAPADASFGVVVADGAGPELLATTQRWLKILGAHPAGAALLAEADAELGEPPFDLLSVDGWKSAGLDPTRGLAAFFAADGSHVAVFPVVDRAAFRSKVGLRVVEREGVAIDVFGDHEEVACRELGGRYVCAQGVARVLALAAGTPPMAARRAGTPDWARGDVELVLPVDELDEDLGFARPPTVVVAALRLEDDGAEWRVFADARFRGDDTRFVAPPPRDWATLTAGASGAMWWRMDAKGAAPELVPTVPMLGLLDGEFIAVTRGTTVAGGVMWLGVSDPAAARAELERLCQLGIDAGVPSLAWDDAAGACSAAHELAVLGKVSARARVDGRRLVLEIGDGAAAPAGAPKLAARVGSRAAARLLAETSAGATWAADFDFWARLDDTRRGEIAGLLGGEATAVFDFIGYLGAHLYEATSLMQTGGEGSRFTVRVTSFAGDPAAARAAHDAALARRAAGDFAGYREALRAAGKAHPGTLVAKQAELVLANAPALGPFGSLFAAGVAAFWLVKDSAAAPSATSEAKQGVRRMYDGARSFWMDGQPRGAEKRFPKSSNGPVPPLGTCCAQGGQCQPDPKWWDTDTWWELKFSVDDPHYYSYEFVSDGTRFTAAAYGDLDCDGVYSTFEMVGAVDADGAVSGSAGMFIDKEFE